MQTLDALTFPLTGIRMVEASAGTGKTHAITQLYLRALLGHRTNNANYDVHNILVLTFTTAATEELRGRIRDHILSTGADLSAGRSEDPFTESLLAQVDKDAAKTRLTAAGRLLDEAAILTIHGFCMRIIRDLAFETGTLFDRRLVLDAAALQLTAAADFYREEMASLDQDEVEVVLGAYHSPTQLLVDIQPLLARELTLEPMEPINPGDMSQLKTIIAQIKDIWLSQNISQVILDSGVNKGRKAMKAPYHAAMNDFALSTSTTFTANSRLDWWMWAGSTLKAATTKRGRPPEHPVFDLIERVAEGIDRYAPAVLTNFRGRAIRKIRARLEREKLRSQTLTFDDLLTNLRDALRADARHGSHLARRLAAQYPLAIVDEFQDTDDAQYEIFKHIYGHSPASLILIGDPKQAIYKFRGADIFTYIDAKQALAEQDLFSLATNWRATPDMVSAVNRLFSREGVFRHSAIPYPSVTAAPREHLDLTVDGKRQAAMTMFCLTDTGQTVPRNQARRLCAAWAAEEVARLLNAGRHDTALIGHEPVTSGRIAILARDRHDAIAIREALALRAVKSVYVTLESVLLSPAARDLLAILVAILTPANERYLRTALATPLMGASSADIDALGTDVRAHQALMAEFVEYHQLWARSGIASMINAMIARRRLASYWLERPDGERQMTNLRHLAELLQQRAVEAPGQHRLVKWYARELETATTVAPEERQLRLESDHDLVQIVTMHSAKGLEYDIVFVPMANFGMRERRAIYHEQRNTGEGQVHVTVADLTNSADGLRRAQDEQLAEDIRLLYVTITRAKYKCYLGIADTDRPRVEESALGAAVGFTGGKLADHLKHTFPDFEHIQIDPETIGISTYNGAVTARPVTPAKNPRSVPTVWRSHSYTALGRQLEDTRTANTTPGLSDDDEPARYGTGAGPTAANTDSTTLQDPRPPDRYSFPRGPRAGVMLHLLLEEVGNGTPAEFACRTMLARFGLPSFWIPELVIWVDEILATPLLQADINLSQISQSCHELEFHFPLAGVEAHQVTALCQAYGYLEQVHLPAQSLAGVMTGTIDLTFEANGRFFLADYKSNHLGFSRGDYAAQALEKAIVAHHYDLQYLLYTVAFNRHLRRTVPGYSYTSHFGGVAYLFLRGMHPDTPDSGVFWDRPAEALVSKLDALLATGAEG